MPQSGFSFLERDVMGDNNVAVLKGVKRRYKVIAVVFLVLAVGFGVVFMRGKSKLEMKLDEVRAAGFPVTPEELNDWYSIPEGEKNAADVYVAAFDSYYEPDSTDDLPVIGKLDSLKLGEKFSAETIKLMEEFIADNEETLEFLRDAAKIKHCRYPVDFSVGYLLRYDLLGQMKRCAMMLNLKAMLDVEKNRVPLVVEDIEVSIAIARSCESAPVLMYQLVRIACLALSINLTEYAINRIQFDDDQLGRLASQFNDAAKLDGMYMAMVGERALVIDGMLYPEKYPAMRPGRLSFADTLYSVSGLKNSGLIEYIDFISEIMTALRLPPHKRQAALKLVLDKMEGLSWFHMLVKQHTTLPSRMADLELRCISYLRAVAAGLAVERYRFANGKLPETLDEIAPAFIEAVPIDPFDGKQIRYKRLDKGYVVYSVGSDLVDNGGTKRSRETRDSCDEAFKIER